MQEIDLRVLARGLAGTVLHVVGVGDDEPRPLLDHVVHQLGDGDTLAIGRVDLVDVEHFRARDRFLNVPAGLVMRLAPTVIVVGADQQQPE